MSAAMVDDRMWHSDHYRMSQHTDTLSGPIWDALTDHPGITIDALVPILAEDLRVRAGMSYYLSFGEEQALRPGAPYEDAYRDWPEHGTPEEKSRYTLAERTAHRLRLMADMGYAKRKVIQSSLTGWEAGRPPKVWEPLPAQCPACGRKNTRKGRRRDWVYREGTGPSIHTRTRNSITDLLMATDGKRAPRDWREIMREAAELLQHHNDGPPL